MPFHPLEWEAPISGIATGSRPRGFPKVSGSGRNVKQAFLTGYLKGGRGCPRPEEKEGRVGKRTIIFIGTYR
jgi:hypothetical protein